MKNALLYVVAVGSLGLAGCCSTERDRNAGRPSFEYETSAGSGLGYQNDLTVHDPRGAGVNWRYGGDPDRIPPRLPVSRRVEETPTTPVVPETPGPASTLSEQVNPGTTTTTTTIIQSPASPNAYPPPQPVYPQQPPQSYVPPPQ